MRWKLFLSRKLPYLTAIVLLLVPISWLSMPPSGHGTQQASPGGQLAQLRAEHGLAQASLGSIDPTSETIRLATLGLRPVAANVLWYKANEFKKREDWYNLKATVDTVTKLQPHFISVWRFQAWNLAYNVSVEWDDYRDRYFWVKSGIEFLEEGTRINRKEATLPWDTGWFISQKMGKSDENKEFRVLFIDDDEFHNNPKRQQVLGMAQGRDERDSWLVGKRYYLVAQRMVDEAQGDADDPNRVRVKGLSPNVMHAEVPLNQIHYAEALVKEGTFGEKARQAWAKALREWAGDGPDSYGQRLLATPAGAQRMNDFEKYDSLAKDRVKKLKALSDETYDRIYKERYEKLTPEQKNALKLAEAGSLEAADPNGQIAAQAQEILKIEHKELAAKMPDAVKKEAAELAAEAMGYEHIAYWINRYGDIVNFPYWKTRCLSEQTRNTQDSHEQLYKAHKAAPQGHFEEAQDAFELAMEHTRVTLEEHRLLLEDGLTGQDLMDVIREYQQTLGHLDEKFPVKGFGMVAPGEVADWPALCTLLVAGAEKDAPPGLASRIAGYWREKKDFAWAEAAATAAGQVAKSGKIDPGLRTDLVYGLNQAIQWPQLVREEDLKGVELRPALAAQLKSDRKNLPPRLVRQFNRQVLEDALGKAVLVPLSDPPGFVLDNVLKQHKALIKDKLLPYEEEKPADEKPGEKKGEPKQEDVKKSEEKKPDEKKAEPKVEEKKAEEKKVEEAKAEEKKIEPKKVEEPKKALPPTQPATKAPPSKAPPVKTPAPPVKTPAPAKKPAAK